jgi:hypothetical protein
MTRRTKIAKSADPAKMLQFLGAAFDDYLGARVLLRSDLLVQGAVLASTAIEKYCKTVLAFRGNESPGHLKPAHWRCLRNFDAQVYATFNEEFFELLQKAYALRYPDSLPIGYNIVIRARELLAELDHTVLTLHPRFNVTRSEGTRTPTRYDEMVREGDPRLVEDNHFIRGEKREAFITRDNQAVYECRRITAGPLMEIHYTMAPQPSDGAFMREGFREQGDGKTFLSSAEPGQELVVPTTCEKCGKSWTERIKLAGQKMTFLDRPPAAAIRVVSDGKSARSVRLLFAMCEECEPERIAQIRKEAASRSAP